MSCSLPQTSTVDDFEKTVGASGLFQGQTLLSGTGKLSRLNIGQIGQMKVPAGYTYQDRGYTYQDRG
jgi:hypothetical protein